MEHILHVENKILRPVQLYIHAKLILFDDAAAEKLVPQNAVIEIGRVPHHFIRIFLAGQELFLLDVSILGHLLADHTVEIGNDHIAGRIVLHGTDKKPRGVRRNPVIRIQKLNVSARCAVQCLISRIRHTGIRLVDGNDPCVLCRIPVNDLRCFILASVIHDQKLEIGIGLIQNALNASSDRLLRVICRYDNADCCHIAPSLVQIASACE